MIIKPLSPKLEEGIVHRRHMAEEAASHGNVLYGA